MPLVELDGDSDTDNTYCDSDAGDRTVQRIVEDQVLEYSSADGGSYQSVRDETLEHSTSLTANERAIGAIERAMRRPGDWTKEQIFLPTIGTTFPGLGDAYQFYNLYSWEVGFSIRRSKNQGGKTQNMQEYRCQRAVGSCLVMPQQLKSYFLCSFVNYVLMCTFQGKPTKNCKYSTTMCGCPARLRLLRSKTDGWYVSIFDSQHNHELVESCGEKRHLHSHQSIDQGTKDLVRYLRQNNVSLGKVNSIMGSIHGSQENLTFSKKLLKRVCTEIAEDLIHDDVGKTMQLFFKMRDDDPDFVWKFQLDRECRITSIMWSSGNSRRMYSHFGDVVTFDTTYKTNIYEMPFGMFVGVNNHFKSIIYAGVLLTNEDTGSFEWAFETFVEMMGGKKPITMLTDQCPAMGAALRSVLPETSHRWCKWHVLKKVVESLAHLFGMNQSFRDAFNKVVNHMLSQQEFEDGWNAMLDEYGLRGHPELTRAFQSRSLWAKPWFIDIFCARMTSTQRSESCNHVLKGYMSRNSPMNQFVEQYTKLVFEQQKEDHEMEKKIRRPKIP